jgi:hypothetical protein
MKTKTILLIVLFSIGISTTSFAQNQGATLNQTIEWIKSYLGANGEALHIKGSGKAKRYLETITFDPSTKILLIEEKHTKADDVYVSISIDLSKCTSIKKGYLASSSSDFVKYRITDDAGSKSKYDFESTAILFGLTENGDYTKLDKAFKHLFELCGIKLMNEDLF